MVDTPCMLNQYSTWISSNILKNRDIFHFFVNTQNLRLLANAPQISPLTEDDWESEDDQQDTDLLSPTTHRQKMSLIADSELAQICKYQ